MIRTKHFIKRKIGTQFVIAAVGEASKTFNGVISINATGAFIWDQLEKNMTMDELVSAMTEYYDVDSATAREHATAFVDRLKEVGAIAE